MLLSVLKFRVNSECLVVNGRPERAFTNLSGVRGSNLEHALEKQLFSNELQ